MIYHHADDRRTNDAKLAWVDLPSNVARYYLLLFNIACVAGAWRKNGAYKGDTSVSPLARVSLSRACSFPRPNTFKRLLCRLCFTYEAKYP